MRGLVLLVHGDNLIIVSELDPSDSLILKARSDVVKLLGEDVGSHLKIVLFAL